MYRRNRIGRTGKTQRVPKYSYSTTQFPALGRPTKENNQKNWEHIVAKDEQEETVIVEADLYDNIDIMVAEEMISELEERNEIYKWEDDMRYGIDRMNEWDRGYYEGNPYYYSWEYNKMHHFTEEVEGDMVDELD